MKLGRFIEKLDALVAAKDEIKRRVAIEARILIQDGFRKEASPVEVPWAPIKRKGSILQKTGRMRNAFDATPSAGGVMLRNSTDYAQYHQYGTRSIKPRKMLPDRSTGLGAEWSKMISAVFNEIVTKVLKSA